jgi:uncharacterized membrane protein YeaQ/YmgE (transglycosylase-associated protein family)
MEQVTQLLTIEIDQKAVNEAINKTAAARQEVDRLKLAQKQLDTSTTAGAKAFTLNAIEIKKQSTIVRENERVVIANSKAQDSLDGSLDQLRAQQKIVTSQWNALSKGQRENTEAGKALSAQKLDLANKIQAETKATGDGRESVGLYAKGIQDAAKQSGLFGGVIAGLEKAQLGYTLAVKASEFQTSSFKKVLISTGIGAVIILIGSLISFFTRFQSGIDLVSQAFAGITAFVDVFLDALGNLGKQVIDQIMPVLRGLGSVIEGLITFNFSKISDGFDQIGDAVSKIDPINLIEIGKEAARAAEEAANLTKQMQEIVRAEMTLNVERARSKALINELRRDSQDETKSLKERGDALNRAVALEQEQLQAQIDSKLEQLRIQIALNGLATSKDQDLQKEFDIEIQIANLKEQSLNKQIELNGQLRGIEAKKQAEIKALSDAQFKAQEELNTNSLAQLEAQLAAQEEIENAFFESQREIQKEIISTELNDLKEKFIQGLISEQEYNDSINDMQAGALAIRRLTAQLAIEDANNDLVISEAERVRIITESEREIEAVRGESLSKQFAASKAAGDAEVSLEKYVADNKKQTRADVLNFVVEVFGKESLAGKLAASYQAGLNTAEGVTNALASGPPPLNFINAALVGAQGLLQIAKINSTSVPALQGVSNSGGGASGPRRSRSFAKGVIGLEGAGTTTSDSIPANLSRDESVMTAGVTRNFAPLLAMMELAVGNKPNFDGSSGNFANGFIARSVSANVSNSSEMTALRSDLNRFADRPSIVQVSEINRVNSQVQKVKVSGRLS